MRISSGMGPRLAVPAVLLVFASGACTAGPAGQSAASPAAPTSVADAWSVASSGSVLQISCGSGADTPQYAALHTESGYLRMNVGTGSGWGTSVVLVPSFWSGGRLFQGAPASTTWRVEGADLLLSFSATISTLAVAGEVRLVPPARAVLSATVTVDVSGDAVMDRRPGEAFKPVMLSSMHVSDASWDARVAFADAQSFQLPDEG